MFNSIKEFIFPTIESEQSTDDPEISSLTGFFKDLLGIEEVVENETAHRDESSSISNHESQSVNQAIFSNDFLPSLTLKSSNILSSTMASDLRSYLPPLLKEAPVWDLLYSTQVHGISITTLYNNVKDAGPFLLVIKDEEDEIFGGFVNESLHISTGFYGDDTAFLFKVNKNQTQNEPLVQVWKATGENNYIMYADNNCIAFGGGSGRFGLWVDQELWNGHSEPCKAFGNSSLSKESEFRIENLEVFKFKMQ